MKWNWLSKGLTIKAKDLPSGSVGGILLPNSPLYRLLLRCFSSSPAVAVFTCQAKCTDWCPSKRTQEALPRALPSLLGWTQAYTAQSYCPWCTLLLAAVKTVRLSSLPAKSYITSNLLNWHSRFHVMTDTKYLYDYNPLYLDYNMCHWKHLLILSIKLDYHIRELIRKQTFHCMIDVSLKTATRRTKQPNISDLFPGKIRNQRDNNTWWTVM